MSSTLYSALSVTMSTFPIELLTISRKNKNFLPQGDIKLANASRLFFATAQQTAVIPLALQLVYHVYLVERSSILGLARPSPEPAVQLMGCRVSFPGGLSL